MIDINLHSNNSCFIVHELRSGSTYLSKIWFSYLEQHGYKSFLGEYFNDADHYYDINDSVLTKCENKNSTIINTGVVEHKEKLQVLLDSINLGNKYVIKIHPNISYIVLKKLIELNSPFLCLTRRDKFNQFLSYVSSTRTNLWNVNYSHERVKYEPITVDEKDFMNFFKMLKKNRVNVNSIPEKLKTYFYYEDITSVVPRDLVPGECKFEHLPIKICDDYFPHFVNKDEILQLYNEYIIDYEKTSK